MLGMLAEIACYGSLWLAMATSIASSSYFVFYLALLLNVLVTYGHLYSLVMLGMAAEIARHGIGHLNCFLFILLY